MFNTWLLQKGALAYIISVVAFAILSLIFRSIGGKRRQFMNNANLIVVFVLTLNLLFVLKDAFTCRLAQLNHNSSEEGYDFYLTKNCFLPAILTVCLGYSVQFLFWFRRYRDKWWITTVSAAMILLLIYAEKILIIITSWYRDYLPSSWSVAADDGSVLWTLFFSIGYFCLCYFVPARRK